MSSEPVITLGLMHWHNDFSNGSEKRKSQIDKDDFYGHLGNNFELHDRLPENICLFANLTNHHEIGNPLEWGERQVEMRNGEITEVNPRYMTYSYDDLDTGETKRGALSFGVESSTDLGQHSHIGHAFVDTEKYDDFSFLSGGEVLDRTEEIPLNWIAHPYVPHNWTPEDFIHDFLEKGEESGVENHVEYSTGYAPVINDVGKGLDSDNDSLLRHLMLDKVSNIDREENRESDIFELAETYDCSFIYGNDWHAGIGRKGDGLAIAEGDDIIEELEAGTQLPIEEIKDMDVIEYDDRYLFSKKAFWKNFDYARNFPRTAPSILKLDEALGYIFDNRTNYEHHKKSTLNTYEDVEADELLENSHDPRLDNPF